MSLIPNPNDLNLIFAGTGITALSEFAHNAGVPAAQPVGMGATALLITTDALAAITPGQRAGTIGTGVAGAFVTDALRACPERLLPA